MEGREAQVWFPSRHELKKQTSLSSRSFNAVFHSCRNYPTLSNIEKKVKTMEVKEQRGDVLETAQFGCVTVSCVYGLNGNLSRHTVFMHFPSSPVVWRTVAEVEAAEEVSIGGVKVQVNELNLWHQRRTSLCHLSGRIRTETLLEL